MDRGDRVNALDHESDYGQERNDRGYEGGGSTKYPNAEGLDKTEVVGAMC